MSETPKESFLRNHQENIRMMRAAAKAAEREGRIEDAKAIQEIADKWDMIAAFVESEDDE